jgi:dihydroorotase-like cyclic amidohydrolase
MIPSWRRPGIENRLQLIYHHGVNAGKLTVNRFVELVSAAPARIFGMYPQRQDASHARRPFDV